MLTQANKERHIPILHATGLLTPNMVSVEMWRLSSDVALDSVVSGRVETMRETHGENFPEDTIEVLKQMTEQERAALRQRVGR